MAGEIPLVEEDSGFDDSLIGFMRDITKDMVKSPMVPNTVHFSEGDAPKFINAILGARHFDVPDIEEEINWIILMKHSAGDRAHRRQREYLEIAVNKKISQPERKGRIRRFIDWARRRSEEDGA